MATPQEVKNQADLLDLATQYADQMKFIVKAQQEKGALDDISVSLSRQLVRNVQDANKYYESSKDVTKEINRNQTELNKVLLQQETIGKGLEDSAKRRIQFIQNQEKGLANSKKLLAELRKQEEEGVAGAKEQADQLAKQVQAQGKRLSTQYQNLSAEEQQVIVLNKISQSYTKNIELLGEELEAQKELDAEAKRRNDNLIKSQSLITAAISGTNSMLNKMGFGMLANKLGFEKASEVAKKMTNEMTDGGRVTLGFFGRMRVAGAALGTVLKAALNPLTLLIAGVALFSSLFRKAKESAAEGLQYLEKMSEQSTGLARSLGISQNNAEKLAGSARAIGGAMGMTTEMATRSAGEIYGAMKGVETLSGNTMKTFMQLNVFAGVSADTLDEMHKMAKLTGQDAGVLANNMANTAAQSIRAYGVNVSQKEVMAGVAKQSNEIKLNFGGSAEGLTRAFVKAKSLGFELEKMKNIAQGLLNIEDSIAAEMEAELLTGKELNLEKAREAALNHDYATLTEEIAKNIGSAAEFEKMNVLQQEAAAKAIGMSSEELADILAKQKQNKSENQELLDVQKQGIAAMSSMASLAERMQAMEEEKAAMRANEAKDFLELKKVFHEIDKILRPIYSEIFAGILGIVKDIATEFEHFLGSSVKTGAVAEKIKGFFAEIRPMIKTFAQNFFHVASVVLPLVIKGFKTVFGLVNSLVSSIRSFFDLFGKGNRNVSTTKALIGGIATALLGLMAYYKAMNALQAFGNTLLGKRIKSYLTEKQLLQFNNGKISAGNKLNAVGNKIKEGYNRLLIKENREEALSNAKKEIGNKLGKVGSAIKNGFLALLKKETYTKGIGNKLSAAGNAIATAYGNLTKKNGVLENALNNIKKKGLIGSLSSLLTGVFSYAVSAAKAVAGIPIVGPVLAVAALGAAVAGGMALYNKAKSQNADDLYSSGGYGTRTLLGPEGAIRLNNKDSVIAGTNLFDKGKGGGGGSDPALVAEMQAIRSVLQQILTKEGVVMIDGNKVGSTLALASYKTQ